MELELRLPFGGAPRRVIQGAGGRFSHVGRNRWAWDFAMPERTPVLAAAGGIVVEVVDEFDRGGPDRRLAERANAVVVDHGGGRFSVYQHLCRGGARVREGQRVARGQAIGLSGESGFCTRPHLHFQVVDHVNQSLPIRFADVRGGLPVCGECYRSRNRFTDGDAAPTTLTALPRHAFAPNGVLLDVDLPARWIGCGERVRVAGVVACPTRCVVAFFFPRGDGRAHRWFHGPVDDNGHFQLAIDLAGLRGPMNFALAPSDDDGRFHSNFSVPCAIAPRPAIWPIDANG